jgi:hypothetical protein
MTVGATAAASTQPFGGSARREMKRKIIYSIIVVALFGFAALWYLPSHIWSAQSMDGAGPVPTDQANEGKGFGPSGRGVGFSTTTWKSVSGVTVEEIAVRYSSANDARADFELELKNGGIVVQRTDDTAADHQRAMKVIGDANHGTSEIVTRTDDRLSFITAGALKYALTFEDSVLKF